MIFDAVIHAQKYRGISPQLDIALELMQQADFFHAPPGREEVRDGVYYIVMDCNLVPQAEAVWERHENYIDIQWVLNGQERIDVSPIGHVAQWKAYDPARDAAFSSDPAKGTPLDMNQSMFAIFFPQDAHRCCIATTDAASVRKVVIKIPV